jgi:transposase
MDGSVVRRWCGQLESGRDNVHDDKRSGRPSVVTPELVQQIEVQIRENRRFTITDLAAFLPEHVT